MKNRKLWTVICLLVFLIGLLILCFPTINKYYVRFRMKNAVESYLQNTVPADKEPEQAPTEESIPEETQFEPAEYRELWDGMQAYNERIWKEKQTGLCSTQAYAIPSFYPENYGLESDVFGVLTIPAMDLTMPLYLGATWQHMSDGAAQLSETSLPIGGKNTNCVIACHRGWWGAPYFKEILKLKKGDEVTVQNPWQTLHYTVTECRVIQPNDIESIRIRDGRDMITLLTCHPLGAGGRQRYLVFCDRNERS